MFSTGCENSVRRLKTTYGATENLREVKMTKETNFSEGKILGPLMKFAIPILLAILLQAMYGAVDLLVVGRFGASADVSAVSNGSQIMLTLTAAVNGLAMGTTILIGQMIGQGKREQAGKAIGASLCLFLVVAAVITILMEVFAEPVACFMHTPLEAFEQTVSYIRICCGGAVFIVAYNLLGSIFRGIGDSKTPLVTVAIACVINIFGDLLLVGGFHMAVEGAALATVAAQAFSVVTACFLIRKKGLPFPFGRKDIRFYGAYIRKILKLGFPVALQDGLVNISFLVVLAIVNRLGVAASAGMGVAEKLCGFIMLVPSAFMQSMSAFVAQNIGAGKYHRASRALMYGIMASFSFGLVMAYISFFHGDFLAGLFSNDAEVIADAFDYLKAYAIDCLLTAFLFCFVGYFNGCGKTGFVMVQGMVGAFLIRIPVSWLMSSITPVSLFAVGLATPCSTVIQIVLCTVCFMRLKKQREKTFYD